MQWGVFIDMANYLKQLVDDYKVRAGQPTTQDAITNMATVSAKKTNGVSTATALMNQTGGSIMGFTYE